MNTRTTIQTLLLLATASLPLYAQPVVEPITQNPDAVLLRRIWTITGNDGDRVGQGCGPVGDINGDSITDFAVQFGLISQWRVYLGGSPAPTTEPVWVGDSLFGEISYPIYGDFFDNDSVVVAFSDFIPIEQSGTRAPQLRFFRAANGTLSDSAMVVQDMYSRSKIRMSMDVVLAANMDEESGDELIIANGGVRRQEPFIRIPEIWLYRGGSGFQVDTPSYIIRDEEATTGDQFYTAKLFDLDGDRYVDLLSVAKYAEGFKLKMWFGTETSPWTWTQPDRQIILYNTVGLYYPLFEDFDGDRKLDIAALPGPGSIHHGLYLYLSRNAPSFREHSFLLTDAQRAFSEQPVFPQTIGWLNDSSNRVAMLGIRRPVPSSSGATALAFSGSRNGPDAAFDALYGPHLDGLAEGNVFDLSFTGMDYNGDGWRDHLTSNSGWPSNKSGIVLILAGGPYIPLDDPTVSVRTEPMANHQKGLYLWPNPATTELNLAWRGDLATMPTRFSIHDIAGKLITENEIRPEHGSARWSTAAVPSGTYLLTAYDRSGKVLASTQILVQH